MNEDMMVIPLRVPREVGRKWKLEAVKSDQSVQKWILDQLRGKQGGDLERVATAKVGSPPTTTLKHSGLPVSTKVQEVEGEPIMEKCESCGDVFKITDLVMNPKFPGKRFCRGCVENMRNGQ